MKQNDAVFSAVCEVLGQSSFSQAVSLSKEQRGQIIEIVTDGILNGRVDFSSEAQAKYNSPDKVRGYTSGMVNNHLRKDKRLNGGAKYEAKNPGSRAGQGDAQLKAMKALRSQLTDSDSVAEIETAIENRIAELKAAKVKTIAFDASALPEHLRHLVK